VTPPSKPAIAMPDKAKAKDAAEKLNRRWFGGSNSIPDANNYWGDKS
jgi:hypothetical protein